MRADEFFSGYMHTHTCIHSLAFLMRLFNNKNILGQGQHKPALAAHVCLVYPYIYTHDRVY